MLAGNVTWRLRHAKLKLAEITCRIAACGAITGARYGSFLSSISTVADLARLESRGSHSSLPGRSRPRPADPQGGALRPRASLPEESLPEPGARHRLSAAHRQ